MRHSTKTDKFFSREEKDRIRQTTCDVESRTSGEVAVMVVESSDRYMESEIIGGVLLASLISLLITVYYLQGSVWSHVVLSFLLFFPSFLLFKRFGVLKRAFIGHKRKREAVKDRALRAFYEKGLYRTRHRTGVLFFLSLLERKVWVLADKGIHEKITQKTLNGFAMMISRGIREGRSCETLCDAIRQTGELLALHFPKTPDDTDELPDDVMTE